MRSFSSLSMFNIKQRFMRLKLILILFTILFTTAKGHSQVGNPDHYKNIVHLEAGGIGGYGSLNYERMIPLSGLFSVSGRIGISTIRLYDFTNKFNPDILFPISVNGFFGKSHKIHLGFGQLIANSIRANHTTGEPIRETNFHTHFAVGYRYQKADDRLILGISYTPAIEFQQTYRHWGAVTFGFAF